MATTTRRARPRPDINTPPPPPKLYDIRDIPAWVERNGYTAVVDEVAARCPAELGPRQRDLLARTMRRQP